MTATELYQSYDTGNLICVRAGEFKIAPEMGLI